MPKARELTNVEKFYIENNLDKTDEQIASEIKGVGPRTVAKYRESIPAAVNQDQRESITETREERIDRLGNGPKTGDFIAKQSGAAIMTEQASEVSDARAIVKGRVATPEEFEAKNRDKIHRPQS